MENLLISVSVLTPMFFEPYGSISLCTPPSLSPSLPLSLAPSLPGSRLSQVAGPIGRAPAKEKRGDAAKGRSGSGFGGKLRADGADIFGKVGKGKCAKGNEKKGKWKSKASGGISRPPPSTMGYDNPPPEG